ncbi:DUF6959 family protein [Streptomyces sp. NPDC019443]|uniref:DUF6959 family protein n=1 Tax=Streptomyces sp. NPDC019443 TaxID=3365061 RepID=UPI0037A47E75
MPPEVVNIGLTVIGVPPALIDKRRPFSCTKPTGLDGPMEHVEAELFTDGGNNAVVRLPGRRFPGVLIQGDSLSILRSDVAEVVQALDQGDVAGARETAGLLLADLDALLTRYSAALEAHKTPRPY